KGDIIVAVGPRKVLEKFRNLIGRESEVNLLNVPGRVASRKIIVTRKEVLGKTLAELNLKMLFGVAITRVARADLEMSAVPELKLQFGDTVQVVGNEEAMAKVSEVLGNRVHALNETNFIPIFIGIALGVLVGTFPLVIPNMP